MMTNMTRVSKPGTRYGGTPTTRNIFMRFTLPLVVAVSLLALQAQAQTTAPAPSPSSPPAASAPPSSTLAPAETPAAPRRTHSRMTLQQRFDAANTTHDGHLTLDQAKLGLPMVAKHFDAIDKDKKGYVTIGDIHAYASQRRAARHSAPHPASAS